MVSGGKINTVLCGDIGGTHTRLAVFCRGGRRVERNGYQKYENQNESSLEDIIEKYITHQNTGIDAAWLAIDGPIEDGRTKTTNLPWEISESDIKDHFGFNHVRLVNDLSAMAFSVPWLTDDEQVVLNPGMPRADGTIAVLAPGTGLGMAMLTRPEGRYHAVASEGGHTDFAPSHKNDPALWEFLHDRYGHVSNERVVSGPGLVNIYQWILHRNGNAEEDITESLKKNADPAEIITRSALDQTDENCISALDMFVSVFGSVAGNLALLCLATGGIYLGGGIPPKILPKLYKNSGPFFRSFISKGRFEEWMRKIPVHVITHDNPALLGVASMAFYDQPEPDSENTA